MKTTMTKITKLKATLTQRRLAVLVIVAAVPTVVVGAALATRPSGIVTAPVVARASFVDSVDIKFKIQGQKSKGGGQRQEVIHVRDAQETVMQQIVIAPGGNTGWHSHPGPVVVLVKSGTLAFYDEGDPTCTSRTYTAGQAFVDSGQGHVHIARNLSQSQNLELWATYFDVPPAPPGAPPNAGIRIDVPDPGVCSF